MSANVKKSDELKSVAKKLFDEGKIDVLIGYEEGTLPLRTTPCFITGAEEAERLVWDSRCSNNLAVYLPRLFSGRNRPKGWKPPRAGIVAKGCDGRSIVGLIKEKQVPRENLLVLGVPCRGVVDLKKVEAALDGKTLAGGEVAEDGNLIVHVGGGEDVRLARKEVLFDSCRDCPYPEPPLCDIRVGGEASEGQTAPDFSEIAAFEAKSPQERWEHFSREVSKCIRCYACRQACPNCYCETCFAEQTQPKWLGVGTDLTEVMIYHLGRIFHQAGRCVDCGACVRACPMDIDLRLFTRKMLKDVRELFGYEAGVSLEELPPLCTFKPDDDQAFITEP
jgi:formate dehydrogenase subunit beta